MSLKDSRSLKSPQLGPIRCQSGRSLLPLLCYYFEVIWRHLKAAQRLANSANQKRVLKTRDIPTLTGPSPASHGRRLQSPSPPEGVRTGVPISGAHLPKLGTNCTSFDFEIWRARHWRWSVQDAPVRKPCARVLPAPVREATQSGSALREITDRTPPLRSAF